MYADFFGLRELPFNNTPDPRFFYSTPDHEEALASLIYAVKQRKGFVLLTGEVGAGKTLVSRMMLRHFGTSIAFANINHAFQNPNDLMESLCSEFEIPVEPDMTHTQRIRILHDFLLAQFAQNLPVVLVLDEAQTLPIAAFEQLRTIGNLEADDAKLLQIAIVGQPELQRLFSSPELRQLKQRIFRSFHLPALDRKATKGYIRYRLSVAAAKDIDIFSDDAIHRIYEVSRGLPRLINNVCDNAMLSAYSADLRRIDHAFLETVLAQMMMSGDRPGAETEQASASPRRSPPRPVRALPPTAAPRRGIEYLVPDHSPERVRPPFASRTGGPHPSNANHPATRDPGVRGGIRHRNLEPASTRNESDHGAAIPSAAIAQVAELEAVVRQAESMLNRAMTAGRELESREAKLRELSKTVKGLAIELTVHLDRLQKASAASRRDQRDAKETHDHLVLQTDRSQKLVAELMRISSHLKRDAESQKLEPRLVKAMSAAIAPILAAVPSALADHSAGRWERMLNCTRETLASLRDLAHGPHYEASNLLRTDQRPIPVQMPPGDGPSAYRPADRVDRTVQIVEHRKKPNDRVTTSVA